MHRTSNLRFRMTSGGALLLAVAMATACAPDGKPAARAHVSVAAASDLRFVLPVIITAFAAAHPDIAVEATYGSSGNLATQIINGAPFNVLLSADEGQAQRLVDGGHARADSRTPYAIGQLALWVPAKSALDVTRGLDALRDAGVGRIAIANPEHAPYGRAAAEAIRAAGIDVAGRLVLGATVSEAAQFVQTGAADAGLIARSLAVSPRMTAAGRHVVIATPSTTPLRQTGVVVARATDPAAAALFVAFVASPTMRPLFARAGFLSNDG